MFTVLKPTDYTVYTIYSCNYLCCGDGGSSDDDDQDSQSSMNTANEINHCPLYNRYNQIHRGWELDGETNFHRP
jgi:hypothetical protein